MKIAIAQMNSTPGALDATVSAMAAYGRRAEELGADLLVFGAPVLMGPDPMGLAANEAYLLDASRSLAALAEKLRVPALVPYTSNITGTPVYDVAYLRDGAAVPISLTSMLDAIGPGDVETVARGIREHLDADAGAEGQGQQAARLIDPAVIEVGGVDVGVALSLGDLRRVRHRRARGGRGVPHARRRLRHGRRDDVPGSVRLGWLLHARGRQRRRLARRGGSVWRLRRHDLLRRQLRHGAVGRARGRCVVVWRGVALLRHRRAVRGTAARARRAAGVRPRDDVVALRGDLRARPGEQARPVRRGARRGRLARERGRGGRGR